MDLQKSRFRVTFYTLITLNYIIDISYHAICLKAIIVGKLDTTTPVVFEPSYRNNRIVRKSSNLGMR